MCRTLDLHRSADHPHKPAHSDRRGRVAAVDPAGRARGSSVRSDRPDLGRKRRTSSLLSVSHRIASELDGRHRVGTTRGAALTWPSLTHRARLTVTAVSAVAAAGAVLLATPPAYA